MAIQEREWCRRICSTANLDYSIFVTGGRTVHYFLMIQVVYEHGKGSKLTHHYILICGVVPHSQQQ
jgi:hypothetical protein